MSAEDTSSSRTARVSPSHQRNGHDDRKGSVSRMEDTRGSTRQTHPEHLSTGPASLAAKGSSSSIPYVDCSHVDSEYNTGRDQARRVNPSYTDQVMLHRGSDSGSANGALQAQQERFLGRMRFREFRSVCNCTDCVGLTKNRGVNFFLFDSWGRDSILIYS